MSAILVNGYLSSYFDVKRGIRQGDALSALLYIIQSEPLADVIRKSPEIEGIMISGYEGETEIRVSQYVDDMTVFLRKPEMLDSLTKIISSFGSVSGSKLNLSKCKGLFMRPGTADMNQKLGIQISEGSEKVLGIKVGKHFNRNDQVWDKKLKVLENRLSIWQMRELSLKGRVYLLKSIGLSSMIYNIELQEIHSDVLNKFVKICFDFLWKKKRPLVRREICYLPIEEGGLNMFDLTTVVKVKRIQFVQRVLRGEMTEPWKIIPLKYFRYLDNKFGIDYFCLKVSDSSLSILNSKLPTFYKECILDYQEFIRKSDFFNDGDEIIWYNTKIRFKKNPLALDYWSRSGIKTIGQIIKPDGGVNIDNILPQIDRACKYFDAFKLKKSLPDVLKKVNEFGSMTKIHTMSIQDLLNKNVVVSKNGLTKSFGELTGKEIYSILGRKKNVKVKSIDYWTEKFGTDFILKVYFEQNVMNKLLPTKFFDFQYKIFHGVLSTEKRLEKMKLSNGKCVFCDEVENVEHLFVNCTDLNKYWQQVECIVRKVHSGFILSFEMILLGCLDSDVCSSVLYVVNFVLSFARFILWKRRNLKRYEKKIVNIDRSIQWLKMDLIYYINILSNTKILKIKTSTRNFI